MTSRTLLLSIAMILASISPSRAADPIAIDMTDYRADCGVKVGREGETLAIVWPIEGGDAGMIVLDLRPGKPLFESLVLARDIAGKDAITLASGVDPAYFVTVGSRVAPGGRPPGMSPFNTFFDSPAKRPHRLHRGDFTPKSGRVTSRPGRVTVHLDGLVLGPFAGGLDVTVYAGARLVHVEAVVATIEENCAYFYDSGLVGDAPGWRFVSWIDAERRQNWQQAVTRLLEDRPIAVGYRSIFCATTDGGTLAVFPPPHQYFFPRDFTDNLQTAWVGRLHPALEPRFGIGIRQVENGGGNFSPWVNAPPGTEQRLGVFYCLGRDANGNQGAWSQTLRYTHDDRFPNLPGHVTFTSHWHMATAIAAMKEIAEGKPRTTPDFVKMFKDMGVQIVHLAEFHGDGHPQDPGPLRLPELEAMFDECRRLSDDKLLFLPGEEANVHYNAVPKGAQAGHWLYLFPKPVRWIMKRGPGEPFVEEKPGVGPVYRVGNRDDMLRLMEAEHGLAWTAHARIKSSAWTPDGYRDEAFYKSPTWLGAAWKAMPADNSKPRLGSRVLDLFDDMSNWGGHKYVIGEVDVFKLDNTHELYGHMNVNYVRLDRIPRFDEGWQPLLDALKAGKFFVTTGEVLIRDFTIGGASSGGTIKASAGPPELRLDLEWTFPLKFAEVISGDGRQVYRERIDLTDTGPFGKRTLTIKPDLRGRTWARVEVWDVAVNGAFTQPVWIERD